MGRAQELGHKNRSKKEEAEVDRDGEGIYMHCTPIDTQIKREHR
jgi:hypothetical protein